MSLNDAPVIKHQRHNGNTFGGGNNNIERRLGIVLAALRKWQAIVGAAVIT